MTTKNFFAIVFSILVLMPLNAGAIWGKTGHRTVGAIADNYLKGSTKRALKKLLNHESLAFVSTYSDEIKADDRYKSFASWHYINMPLDVEYDVTKQNPKGDLVSGIEKCKTVLLDANASQDDKAFYLRMLIHLIGDLHQPMHVGLAQDRGGNDFKVQWHYRDTNLHKVWDTKILEDYGMSYSELANNTAYLSKAEIKTIQDGTVIDWVNDTHVLTRKVYATVKEGDNLRYDYSYQYLNVARKQLQIAGIRLAKVLNEVL